MNKVSIYTSARDTGDSLAKSSTAFSDEGSWRENDLVCVEDDFEYQTIHGFGGALTESAAVTWRKLPAAERRKAVRLCFDPAKGLGYTLARVHMNSCDFSLGNWSCDDTPDDFALKNFSIAHYREAILPLIEAAQSAAGKPLWLLGSPWSPPAWMKTNGRMNEGGSLKPECRDAWALFFAKFAKAMAREGFPPSLADKPDPFGEFVHICDARRPVFRAAADAVLELPEVLPVEEAVDRLLAVLESKVNSK